jgi:hypothetical protein
MSTGTTSIWRRLRRNQAENAAAFQRARIEVQDIAPLRCPSCGLEESALFWSPLRRDARRLRLSCPVCSQSDASYDLRRNACRGPVDVRRVLIMTATAILLLVLTGAAFVRYAPPTDQLRHELQRSWHRTGSAAGDAVDWVEQTVRRALRRR